jgi:hypothetical protein
MEVRVVIDVHAQSVLWRVDALEPRRLDYAKPRRSSDRKGEQSGFRRFQRLSVATSIFRVAIALGRLARRRPRRRNLADS